MQLLGDCGLRVAEVLDVRPEHIDRMSDGRRYELEVVGGKDTTGEYEDGKHRETWLPVEFEAVINRYVQERGLADDELLIDRSKRTVQYWVEEAAGDAAAATGDDGAHRLGQR